MRRLDRETIAGGVPGRLLMENAGRAVALAARRRFSASRRPLVVCGSGNNGGDGFVVARTLHDWDTAVRPRVACLGDPQRASEETRVNFELLLSSGAETVAVASGKEIETLLEGADMVIDAVFGVGLTRPVEGTLRDILEALEHAPLPVLALDVPSGISSDTGARLGAELTPDLIVTLGLPKLGLAVRRFAAETLVADIGLPAAPGAEIRQHLLTPEAVCARLPARPAGGHKGSFGHVLVIAGSEGKTGAAALAASGALRAGAGLVTAAAPRRLNPILEVKLTAPMTLAVGGPEALAFEEDAVEDLLREAAARDAAVVGPGLGRAPATLRALERLLARLEAPAVVDADGLFPFAERPEALRGPGVRILTPHPGEMSRLLGRSSAAVQADRAGAARELAARSGAIAVLKGERTIVAAPDGALAINPTGGPTLASGGTGDVLAGMIAALLAQGLTPADAAVTGVYLHGLAADLLGGAGVGHSADEVAERVPAAWARVREAGARAAGAEDGADLLRRFA
jgi:NAD(P)H-hydrate epimerase